MATCFLFGEKFISVLKSAELQSLLKLIVCQTDSRLCPCIWLSCNFDYIYWVQLWSFKFELFVHCTDYILTTSWWAISFHVFIRGGSVPLNLFSSLPGNRKLDLSHLNGNASLICPHLQPKASAIKKVSSYVSGMLKYCSNMYKRWYLPAISMHLASRFTLYLVNQLHSNHAVNALVGLFFSCPDRPWIRK